MKDRDGFYQKEIDPLEIKMKQIADFEKISIFPEAGEDQEAINELGPGHFVIEIVTLGEWMISISNSQLPDFQSIAENRLFVPNIVTMIAGEPYTITAELSGTNLPKSLSVDSIIDL